MDHRGPEFANMTHSILQRLERVFKTSQPVLLFPSSGTGAWEAALVNTLSPEDRVLAFETGHFATLWRNVALRLGLKVDWIESDWRHGVDAEVVETKLRQDSKGQIKAVLAVHNETSTGITSDVAEVRRAIDAADHPALLMVDAISSLGSIDYRHDEWGIDVTICASQKGLMLPPGLGINAVTSKALEASKAATFPKSYWDWGAVIKMNERGFFPYTPPTHLLYGMDAALDILLDEGLERVFARHRRLAQAARTAAVEWGLDFNGAISEEYSDTLTAIWMPEGYDADDLRKLILDRFDMSLGTGLGKAKGKLFRIGHLGDFNDLMLAGTLCGVEMGLSLAGVPHSPAGVSKALEFLAQN